MSVADRHPDQPEATQLWIDRDSNGRPAPSTPRLVAAWAAVAIPLLALGTVVTYQRMPATNPTVASIRPTLAPTPALAPVPAAAPTPVRTPDDPPGPGDPWIMAARPEVLVLTAAIGEVTLSGFVHDPSLVAAWTDRLRLHSTIDTDYLTTGDRVSRLPVGIVDWRGLLDAVPAANRIELRVTRHEMRISIEAPDQERVNKLQLLAEKTGAAEAEITVIETTG